MLVELDGEPDERGMMMDFQDLKQCLKPLISTWDHAVLVAETDTELRTLLAQTDWKTALLPFDTTSENLATYVADHLCTRYVDLLRAHGIVRVRVRIEETETCYAETEQTVAALADRRAAAARAVGYEDRFA